MSLDVVFLLVVLCLIALRAYLRGVWQRERRPDYDDF